MAYADELFRVVDKYFMEIIMPYGRTNAEAYKSHILTKKSAKRKRGLRKATVLTSADLKRMLRSMAK